jgi:hypothetical protein
MNTKKQKEEVTTSQKVTAFTQKLLQLHDEISRLERLVESGRAGLIAECIRDGWKKMDFHSYYYGSHTELGEGDRNVIFLFHPSVDIGRWVGAHFSHGHNVQSAKNEQFEIWLSGLPEGHYIEL